MKNKFLAFLFIGAFLASFIVFLPGIAGDNSSIYSMMTGNNMRNHTMDDIDHMTDEDMSLMMNDDHMSMMMDGEHKDCEEYGMIHDEDCEEHDNFDECVKNHVEHEYCDEFLTDLEEIEQEM
ncbi:MAG: hypothetical protein ACXAC7_19210 [Candidatus Hodarchaeales archaeon]|jgi:hypothetical protein